MKFKWKKHNVQNTKYTLCMGFFSLQYLDVLCYPSIVEHNANCLDTKKIIASKMQIAWLLLLPIKTYFEIPQISHEFVIKYLNTMPVEKGTGLDDIRALFLKSAATPLSDSIVKICNLSIRAGVFPHMWKHAKVIPIHKKKSQDNRPISILPIASKILEKHVSVHLYKYLSSHNLLNKRQSGFRANHSYESALTLMTEEWLSAKHSIW